MSKSNKKKPWWDENGQMVYTISVERLFHPLEDFIKELESKKSHYDDRIRNQRLGWYVKKDESGKPIQISVNCADDLIELGDISLKELILKYTDDVIDVSYLD